MTSAIHMRLLGSFALSVAGTPVPVASPRLQALLAYLALHAAEPQPRRRLAFLLWPDSSEAQAQTNLRTLLHRLQASLQRPEDLLHIDALAVGWAGGATLALDVTAFEAAFERAAAADQAGDESRAREALAEAAACYTGDLLPDCYDEWVQPERERLRGRLLDALGRLADLLARRRAYPEAIEHLRRVARLDPLNEAVHLALMRLLGECGDRAGALRVYHTLASRLQAELGAQPGDALRAAYDGVTSADAPAPDVAAPQGSPLVGRFAEWRHIQEVWRAAAGGRPTMLVLAGEAGIGKSRLADELLRWVVRQGGVTAAAHCYAAEGDLAYAPVVTLLRSEGLRHAVAGQEPVWLGEIGRLAPDLVEPRHAAPQGGALTEAWQRRRLFEALARAVLASGRPLALLVDDLQWCDHDTLEWLHFVLRFEPRAGLLLVATVRTEEVAPSHPLAELLGALRREGRLSEVRLGPLSETETAELAALVASRALAPAEVGRVYAESEGNPLFVVELVRSGMLEGEGSAIERGGPADERPPMPPSVQAVIARRLLQVSPQARELLRAAAVIGRSFTVEVLGRAAGVGEDALVRGLDELWQRQIIREHGADAYDFSHDRLRAAAYESLSPARRRLLHRRVAEAMAERHAGGRDALSGQIAAHYERAALPELAAAYEQRAAAAARSLYANQEAVARYRRALRLLGPDRPAETAVLLDGLGDLLLLLSRYEEARHAWRRALADTPEDNGVMLAHLHRKLGNAWREEGRYEEAQRAYGGAAAMLGAARETPAWRQAWIELQFERFQLAYWLADVPAMERTLAELQPVVEQDGTPIQRARIHQVRATIIWRRERYHNAGAAVAHQRTYIDALNAIGAAAMLPAAQFQLGLALLLDDDLDGAESELAAALASAGVSGDLSLQSRCLTYLTIVERRRGRVERARELAARSLAVGQEAAMPDYIGAAHGSLAWAALRADDREGARRHGEEALEVWRPLPAGYIFAWVARWPLAALALAHDDVPAAVAHACALLDTRLQHPSEELEPLLRRAGAAAEAGDLDAARAHLAAALPIARALGYV